MCVFNHTSRIQFHTLEPCGYQRREQGFHMHSQQQYEPSLQLVREQQHLVGWGPQRFQ